jgi:hypothetical protein
MAGTPCREFLPLALRWAWQFDGLCQKYGGATSEIVRIE